MYEMFSIFFKFGVRFQPVIADCLHLGSLPSARVIHTSSCPTRNTPWAFSRAFNPVFRDTFAVLFKICRNSLSSHSLNLSSTGVSQQSVYLYSINSLTAKGVRIVTVVSIYFQLIAYDDRLRRIRRTDEIQKMLSYRLLANRLYSYQRNTRFVLTRLRLHLLLRLLLIINFNPL